METEWIYDESCSQIQSLLENDLIEYVVGSVHHVTYFFIILKKGARNSNRL